MRVLIFGASITQGLWDENGGWANRLRQHCDRLQLQHLSDDKYPLVFNLGISGDTTQKLLARLEHETRARLRPGEEILFVFSIGTNNAIIQNGNFVSTAEAYRADLHSTIQTAKKFSDKIMFVGLPCCDETRTNPVAWDSSISYTNQGIQKIENAMQRFCTDQSIPFVPIFQIFKDLQDQGQQLFADGLHPNSTGHQIMLEKILPTFSSLANLAQ